ncbi:D-lactate dehydrogenase (plasmid) [Agrobacterium radiobacter]|uniref:Quinone-dependent D-lactate dehydrogenase n=1 Tax=Agrobacterium tumefaciens str. B6 TaxID=1183423 RepID=A0A822VE17_AGRTU|nr:D-lactate dehydrogenase [Agrobacterium tumefaciens]CVI25365.1 D-lactate dehydrogenase [Agrobacterium tumefaciens str. B6]
MAQVLKGFQTSSIALEREKFVLALQKIVGRKYAIAGKERTKLFRTGYRFGSGEALAVVRPGTLVELWRVVKACVAANAIVIMQAANTGLTGGSTPDGTYDRDVVIVNTLRIAKIQLIDDGRQVICLPGATLFQLEKVLRPVGRQPHSVIGSSCIGASVLGGVSNNSGGSLIQRGPAYTEMALFAQVDSDGELHLINHLGVNLGSEPEAILARLESNAYSRADVEHNLNRKASDTQYAAHVRDINADTPARFNADVTRLFEASGSAGKVVTFAVRLDTFPEPDATRVFYIGTNNVDELTSIRRHALAEFKDLPVSGEYMHRAAFDIAEIYGKDMFLAIRYLGTDRLPLLFYLKSRFDGIAGRFSWLPRDLSDKVMQSLSRLFPRHLPERMTAFRDQYEHHLMLKVAGDGIGEARDYLASVFPSQDGDFFECTQDEGDKAFLHRFAAAGAAVRYRAIHRKDVEDIVALDIALRRNETEWFERLPVELSNQIEHKLYYGHFFCHVFHQDYIVKRSYDPVALEHRMWSLLDDRGAQYPAEHNVGHLYKATDELKSFYKRLDPTNSFNPGVGQCSKCIDWV